MQDSPATAIPVQEVLSTDDVADTPDTTEPTEPDEAADLPPVAETDDGALEDHRLQALAHQTQWLRDNGNIDMLRVLQANPALSQRVAQGELDIYQAHAAFLAHRRPNSAPPAVVKSTGRTASIDVGRLSPRDFALIQERLSRGEAVSLDR